MIRRLCALLLMGLLAFPATDAQVRDKSADKSTDRQSMEDLLSKARPTSAVAAIPLEGAIDAAKYILGPSDVVTLSLWGIVSFSDALTITPEGTLIIPTVGEVKVGGKKLSEAKEIVSGLVKKKYTAGTVTLTLTAPRSFVVTLRGTVLRQGQFAVTAVDRVEKLLLLGASSTALAPTVTVPGGGSQQEGVLNAESVLRPPQLFQRSELYDRASTRSILLFRRNGDTVRVDIPRFYATGEDQNNPFLLDGDIVFVPQKDLTRFSIGVFGAVNAPGRYEFAEGDSLLALIQIAQGVTPSADLSHVRLTRVNERGEEDGESETDLNEMSGGKRPNIALRPGDRILVPSTPYNRGVYGVTVTGEVKKPGMYPILRKGTRLSRLIREIGGFTDKALLSGAIVLRRDDQEKQLFGMQFYALQSLRGQQVTVGDSAYFNADLRASRHPVVVDFVRLIQNSDTTQDIVLQNDDFIYVPADDQTVLVHGQVQRPGYQPFVPGVASSFYIERAGGYSELAVSGETKVIKQATLEWLDPADTSIQPGDQIYVPKKPIRDFYQTFSLVRDIVMVTASLATALILAFQVFR